MKIKLNQRCDLFLDFSTPLLFLSKISYSLRLFTSFHGFHNFLNLPRSNIFIEKTSKFEKQKHICQNYTDFTKKEAKSIRIRPVFLYLPSPFEQTTYPQPLNKFMFTNLVVKSILIGTVQKNCQVLFTIYTCSKLPFSQTIYYKKLHKDVHEVLSNLIIYQDET